MQNFKLIFLRMFFALIVAFSLKLWLSVCVLLNIFHLVLTSVSGIYNSQLGLNHPCCSTNVYSETENVEGCHETLNCYIFNFRALLVKNYIFEVVIQYVISPCTDPIKRKFKSRIFKFLMKLYFLVATVAMITEKLSFS